MTVAIAAAALTLLLVSPLWAASCFHAYKAGLAKGAS